MQQSPEPGPSLPKERFEFLDVLRGFALSGIRLSFHNLRSLGGTVDDIAVEFDAWLRNTCCNRALPESARAAQLENWADAAGARYCHPREDHLLPLHVCFGAATGNGAAANVVLNTTFMRAPVSALLWN